MNNIDFSNYIFRASGLRYLMANGRKGGLSDTVKTYLQDIWISEVYDRHRPKTTGAMQKGTIVESDCLTLVQSVTGANYFKNPKHFKNKYIQGTPDVVDKKNKIVIDIKSSWDLWTFTKVDKDLAFKDYGHQITAYMWLTGMKRGQLMYALVNTPQHIIYDEFRRLSYQMDEQEADKIANKNHIFDDIDPEKRLKVFEFNFDKDARDAVINRVLEAREYLQTLSL